MRKASIVERARPVGEWDVFRGPFWFRVFRVFGGFNCFLEVQSPTPVWKVPDIRSSKAPG